MKLPQLKDEHGARDMPHSGLKAMLQRKLHSAHRACGLCSRRNPM
jgi:hypothetical protein